ncbi:MAG: RtcB family protein [Alphaproteobacteria bacterium]|nr:RtcB family protein [Alphaproteobacteria bacterium]MCW5741490.1 RtcB family protein [Alphaproteobacteria bacterium]
MSGRSYDVLAQDGHKPIKMWTRGVMVADNAAQQLRNVASLPFVGPHVAAMPDVHWGMGATVGSVIPTSGAIVPAAVGVDIGCGMCASLTNLTASDLPDSLLGVRTAIEAAVPHGRTDNGRENDTGTWRGNVPPPVAEAIAELREGLDKVVETRPALSRAAKRMPSHAGTLGTGNHFIEVCLDEKDRVWVMLHSGSRGIGNAIGQLFIELAKQDMRRWFINLPDENLAYIPDGSEHFGAYLKALNWAQKFARTNREIMMAATLRAIGEALGRPVDGTAMAVNCHHNYVSKERHFGNDVWLTRKGAVSAKEGELGIIPGSMGARSYIVRGKGNRDSFMSCSHGAGRAMSRAEAKRRFTLADHEAATSGVECRKDAEVIDETPGAYKDIDAVMAAQTDLVDIVHTLRQMVCVKG